MVRKDYKWPSTGRRRREARARKVAELLFFGSCVNLVTFGLVELLPNGLWLHLLALITGTVGLTYQITQTTRTAQTTKTRRAYQMIRSRN